MRLLIDFPFIKYTTGYMFQTHYVRAKFVLENNMFEPDKFQ